MRDSLSVGARLSVVALLLVAALSVSGRAQSGVVRTPDVELDAVVVDRDDRPVGGLSQDDFVVKEDGRRVMLTRVTEVSAAGIDGPSDARVVSLVLDDNSVPRSATLIMQNIARLFASFARPADVISAVRLTHRDDEAAGGLPRTMETIDAYQAGSLGFYGRTIADTLMQAVTRVARQLEPIEHRRKALICIGRRDVCDPFFEVPENSILWNSWRDAVAETSRAHASVYAVSPEGVESRLDLGGGLADTTGGRAFVRSNDFQRAAQLIWAEASHYYLLEYGAPESRAGLHRLEVSVRRSGLHVHARTRRSN